VSATGDVEGGRPLLRGRIFGFPVHLDLSFIIIMGVFGYYPGISLRDMAIWLLITPVAVLVHELGHAVLARRIGARPSIALAGFGGVTTYVPPRPLTRGQDLSISLAGPFVGLAIGAVLVVVDRSTQVDPGSWQDRALYVGIFVSVVWSVLNLLPVLPLDGGQAMRELLPGDREVRHRRAAGVSIVVAAVVAVVAFAVGQPFLALFMGFFGVSNVLELRRGGQDEAARITPERAVVGLLWNGQAERARQVLESLPPGTEVDLAVHGAVLTLTGDPEQGRALLAQERARRPEDDRVLALVVLSQALSHDWDALVATLQGPDAARVPDAALERAVTEASGTGREDVAGRLRLLRRS
jgi:Zn-dependent protease